MNLLRRRDLVCQEAVELVTNYIEGSLSGARRRRFEAHLVACLACTEYLEQMRVTIELTGRPVSEELNPGIREDLISLYRRWRSHSM